LGTKLTEKLVKRFSPEKTIRCGCLLIAAGFFIMFFDSYITIYLVPIIFGFGFGLYYTANTIIMNEKIDSDIRASVLSLQHALTKISQVVIFTVFGFLLNKVSIYVNFMLISVYVFIGIIIIFQVFNEKRKKVSGNEA
jgi:MFS family permease